MRLKLIAKLCNLWRKAEENFIDTESDSEKQKVRAYQESLNLTPKEIEELNNTLKSIGV